VALSEVDATTELELLARRAAAGDELAFERLARAIRPRLYRWALVQAGDADDAEDITQAALLRLRGGLRGFRFGARLSTWLFTLVRSAAADWRRAARRRLHRHLSYAASQPRSTPPAERSEEARLLALVRERFRSLPARQREIFDLVELQGESAAVVAEQLGLSESTVRVHLLRARRAVRMATEDRAPGATARRKGQAPSTKRQEVGREKSTDGRFAV